MKIQLYRKPQKNKRAATNKRRRTLIEKQLKNRDRFICKLYQCIVCKSFKPVYLMKYYYTKYDVGTFIYAAGTRRAIPCVCESCCDTQKDETWFKAAVKRRSEVTLVRIWRDDKNDDRKPTHPYRRQILRDYWANYRKQKYGAK